MFSKFNNWFDLTKIKSQDISNPINAKIETIKEADIVKDYKSLANFSKNMVNFSKDQLQKTFDLAKIKNEELYNIINVKIEEKAILNLKADLAKDHKSFDDFSNEALELMIANEKSKILEELKKTSLLVALPLLGLDFLI